MLDGSCKIVSTDSCYSVSAEIIRSVRVFGKNLIFFANIRKKGIRDGC